MSDIFVSHKSRDADRLRPLVEVLREQGWDVWWSQDDIQTGADWSETIESALEQARCVVVVWSEESVSGDTDWVFSEAEAARKANKLAPLMLDPVELPKPFDRVQTADLTDWVPGTAHDGLERLVAGIAAILEAKVDYRRLPRPGVPVAHALVAAAGLVATAGPMVYVARVGPSPPMSYLLLALIALAAGAAAFSLIRGLFPWGVLGFRSLRNLKVGVALAASVLFGGAAGFIGLLLGSSGTPVELEFRVQGGASCPEDLRGVEVHLRPGEAAAKASSIDADCRANLRLRAETVARERASVSLDPEAGFIVARPFDTHLLAEQKLVVELLRTATPRVRLAVLEYEGENLSDFRAALSDKLEKLKPMLRDRLSDDGVDRWLGDLELESVAADVITGSDNKRLAYLESTHSLGLLWGEVKGTHEAEELTSRIFVGAPAETGSPFQLASPVSGPGYRVMRDTHGAAFLYALAIDARRLGEPTHLVEALLSEAGEQLPAPALDTDETRRLREEIEEAKAEIEDAEVAG
jgi:hypothetical protein